MRPSRTGTSTSATVVTLDPAVLESYAGAYQRNEKRTYTVTREGTRMFIDIGRGGFSEMFASPKGDFFFKLPTETRMRFLREGGVVTELEFDLGRGETLRAKKVK